MLLKRIVAIIALLVQVVIPMWWGVVAASIFYFWNEGIIEGGIFGAERVIGLDSVGNSIIGKCFLIQPCSFSTLLWGLFFIYSILAAVIAIKVSFSRRIEDSELILYTKKDIIFLVINLITIILAISFVFWNGGLIPRF